MRKSIRSSNSLPIWEPIGSGLLQGGPRCPWVVRWGRPQPRQCPTKWTRGRSPRKSMGYWWDIDGIQSWNIWNLEKWMNWMVMNLGFQVFVSTCSNTLTNKNGNVGTQDSRGKCHGNLPKSMIYLFNIFQRWHFPRQTVRLSTAKRIQNMGALIQPHNRQNLFVFLSSISHISPSHFFGAPSCG